MLSKNERITKTLRSEKNLKKGRTPRKDFCPSHMGKSPWGSGDPDRVQNARLEPSACFDSDHYTQAERRDRVSRGVENQPPGSGNHRPKARNGADAEKPRCVQKSPEKSDGDHLRRPDQGLLPCCSECPTPLTSPAVVYTSESLKSPERRRPTTAV